MGEIAEMMLDGTLCAGCGAALVHGPEDEPCGYPDYCSARCRMEHEPAETESYKPVGTMKPYVCRKCGRRFSSDMAVHQHQRDKHGVAP